MPRASSFYHVLHSCDSFAAAAFRVFSRTHAGVSTDRPSPFAPSVVVSSFPRRAPLAVASALARPWRACPPTDRPNDATTASLLAPSEVSSSLPMCLTRLTHASTVPALALLQACVFTVHFPELQATFHSHRDN